MMNRRHLLALLLATALPIAAQEPWPAKPLRLVVPYPAGGPLDTVARLVGARLGERLHQPVIVDNKPGAGGNIGADVVAKSAPDGYTLLLGAVATHAINPALYPSMPYDAERDFIPVTQLAATPNVLVVHPSVPATNVRELIAYAKAHPGQLNFGSGSTGSAGHLAGELFKSLARVEMTHIPYKGAAPALQDLVAGRLQLMFDNMASARGQVKAGTVRALAVTTAKRSPLAPELPTIAEAGVPGFDIDTWFGIFVPAKTPQPIVERLAREITAILREEPVRTRMLDLGAEPVGSTPAEFAAYVKSEARKYAPIIRASGAKVD